LDEEITEENSLSGFKIKLDRHLRDAFFPLFRQQIFWLRHKFKFKQIAILFCSISRAFGTPVRDYPTGISPKVF